MLPTIGALTTLEIGYATMGIKILMVEGMNENDSNKLKTANRLTELLKVAMGA